MKISHTSITCRGLSDLNAFDRLRLYAIVGGDNQNDNVGGTRSFSISIMPSKKHKGDNRRSNKPRARIAENAAWPGVSRNVMVCLFGRETVTLSCEGFEDADR